MPLSTPPMPAFKKKQKRRSNGLLALGVDVRNIVRGMTKDKLKPLAFLMVNWPEIAGEELAERSRPDRLAPESQGGRVLHIRVETSALALEMEQNRSDLIGKINLFFGKPLVNGVRFSVGKTGGAGKTNAPPPPSESEHIEINEEIEKKLKKYPVQDEQLFNLFASLSRLVSKKD